MSTIIEILARLQKSLSQSEISRQTGIPQSKLSRWSSGSAAAGADDALKLLALDQKTEADLQKSMTEAAKASLIERRSIIRRAIDRERLGLDISGTGKGA